jgi:fluoroacetyl-CoA thioesterase
LGPPSSRISEIQKSTGAGRHPPGYEVHAEAEVVKVLGKRIEFKVSAHDETEDIGHGTHQRMVIDLASFNERLARKRKG